MPPRSAWFSKTPAEAIGLDWWKHDRNLSMGNRQLSAENEELKDRIKRLERQLEASPGTAGRARTPPAAGF